MVVRAQLRYAEQAIPARTPIRSWEGFWEYLESLPARRGHPVPRPIGHNPTIVAYARVDDGRWIADCPWRCGAAFNLPAGVDTFWCTECAGGGLGYTAALVWPAELDKLTTNLESWPAMLQYWPCVGCRDWLGSIRPLCESCRGLQGEAL